MVELRTESTARFLRPCWYHQEIISVEVYSPLAGGRPAAVVNGQLRLRSTKV